MRRALTSIVAALALAACPGGADPSPEAVSDWLGRDGAVGGGPSGGALIGPPRAAPASRLSITVESASGLPDSDSGPGVTDPYVVVEYEGYRYETSVVEGSQEPVWGDSFVLEVAPGGVLIVSLMDEDALGADEKLGVVSRPLAPLRIGERRVLELPFRNGEAGVVRLTLVGLARP